VEALSLNPSLSSLSTERERKREREKEKEREERERGRESLRGGDVPGLVAIAYGV
jgi:dihydrodipicolinate reductase